VSLTLIQLSPDMPLQVRWARDHAVLPQNDDDIGYALHALLAATFGDRAPKPFALVRSSETRQTLLGYATASADTLREHAAAFALPASAEAIGLAGLAGKVMPDSFAVGRRLGFEVRVRPTVRSDRDGDRTRTREVDAFLAAVAGTAPDGGPVREAVYKDWLTLKLADGGAVPETLRMDRFRLAPVHRRREDRRLVGLTGPDATFSGTLIVRQPVSFSNLLARGVGRHRAFGFGMLLLRPA
jgi:CRISPR system Cascade subunit CasE